MAAVYGMLCLVWDLSLIPACSRMTGTTYCSSRTLEFSSFAIHTPTTVRLSFGLVSPRYLRHHTYIIQVRNEPIGMGRPHQQRLHFVSSLPHQLSATPIPLGLRELQQQAVAPPIPILLSALMSTGWLQT